MKVPWTKIFTSLPVWSIGITTFGRIWVHYTFIMSGPMYMKNILHFSIQQNGLLSGTPFLCSYISSVFFCWIADSLVTKNLMKLTNVRKVFTAISQIIPGILCLFIGYLGQEKDIILVLIIWFIAVTMVTASYAGAMASIVDIAPNLAGPVLAFAQTIHMTASFLSPIISAVILTDTVNFFNFLFYISFYILFVCFLKESLEQWRNVFGLASIIATFTYLMFQIYGTSTIQSWNYPKKKLLDSQIITDNILNSAQNSRIINCNSDDNEDDVLYGEEIEGDTKYVHK